MSAALTPPAAAPAPPGFWGTFPDTSLEQQYRADQAAADRATARAVLAVSAAAGLVFGYTDLEQPAAYLPLLIASRAAAAAVCLGVWLRLLRPLPVPAFDRLLFGWCLFMVAWNTAVQASRPPGHLGMAIAVVSMIVITYTILPLPLWRLTLVGAAHLASGLLVAVWLNPVADRAYLRGLVGWAVAANALGWVAGRRLHVRQRGLFSAVARQTELTARLERALAEVRTLRGLIRVCAWCKGIHADGEWHQLESYFGAGGRAEFTHGICPPCLARETGRG